MPDKESQRGIRSAQIECDRLREENDRLQKLLSDHGVPIPQSQTQGLRWSKVQRQQSMLSIILPNRRLKLPCEIRLEDEQTKSGEARVLPLHPEVVALLEDREPKHGPVFDATNLRTEWEKACAAVGLGKRVKVERPDYDWHHYTGLRLHDMRRSAVRKMRVLGNVPETVALKISGHKTRAVYDRYNIVTTGDLHAAMQGVAVGPQKRCQPWPTGMVAGPKVRASYVYGERF